MLGAYSTEFRPGPGTRECVHLGARADMIGAIAHFLYVVEWGTGLATCAINQNLAFHHTKVLHTGLCLCRQARLAWSTGTSRPKTG